MIPAILMNILPPDPQIENAIRRKPWLHKG
ncbi:MAG: hypothetical protein ACI9CE_001587 [Flavobacterium sp.]|jgi:hypothetical protein